VKTTPSATFRHLLIRSDSGEKLPGALVEALREHAVTGGWWSGSGVVRDVEIRAFDTKKNGLGGVNKIPGPVHLLSLEGAIGNANGALSIGMRVVIARDTDSGLETLAGELTSATVVGLEALVTALDDVKVDRALDEKAGVWLVLGRGASAGVTPAKPAIAVEERKEMAEAQNPSDVAAPATASAGPVVGAPKAAESSPGAWSQAVTGGVEAAKDGAPAVRAPFRSGGPGSAMPARPPPRADTSHDVLPEEGDAVEHFAFGSCDVVKSDGDRLHLKVRKDGRIKEIALEMLRVQLLESEGTVRRFLLQRKM
jgi:predicted DNA-binding protein with PD1-like motif